MTQSLRLLDEIIAIEEKKELELKAFFVKAHRASLSLGDSATLHHLKMLKELIQNESSQNGCSCKSVDYSGQPTSCSCSDGIA